MCRCLNCSVQIVQMSEVLRTGPDYCAGTVCGVLHWARTVFCAHIVHLALWGEGVLRRGRTFCAAARSSASLSEDKTTVVVLVKFCVQSIFRFCTQAREFRHLHKVLHREFRHSHKIAQP